MSAIVVISESDTCLVVTASQHTGRGLFFRELLDVLGGVCGVGCKAADHLLIFTHSNTLALDGLDVFKTGEDLVIDGKNDLHGVGATFLDGERMFAESFDRAGLCEIDRDVGSALHFL